jgi:hypothetical protein
MNIKLPNQTSDKWPIQLDKIRTMDIWYSIAIGWLANLTATGSVTCKHSHAWEFTPEGTKSIYRVKKTTDMYDIASSPLTREWSTKQASFTWNFTHEWTWCHSNWPEITLMQLDLQWRAHDRATVSLTHNVSVECRVHLIWLLDLVGSSSWWRQADTNRLMWEKMKWPYFRSWNQS